MSVGWPPERASVSILDGDFPKYTSPRKKGVREGKPELADGKGLVPLLGCSTGSFHAGGLKSYVAISTSNDIREGPRHLSRDFGMSIPTIRKLSRRLEENSFTRASWSTEGRLVHQRRVSAVPEAH